MQIEKTFVVLNISNQFRSNVPIFGSFMVQDLNAATRGALWKDNDTSSIWENLGSAIGCQLEERQMDQLLTPILRAAFRAGVLKKLDCDESAKREMEALFLSGAEVWLYCKIPFKYD